MQPALGCMKNKELDNLFRTSFLLFNGFIYEPTGLFKGFIYE